MYSTWCITTSSSPTNPTITNATILTAVTIDTLLTQLFCMLDILVVRTDNHSLTSGYLLIINHCLYFLFGDNRTLYEQGNR